jgi:hypothetical protein
MAEVEAGRVARCIDYPHKRLRTMKRALLLLIGSFALFVSSGPGELIASPMPHYALYLEGEPDGSVGPEAPNEWVAQPFRTEGGDNVSYIGLAVKREGSPEGELSVEIWDDDGSGLPGSPVGIVGTIDLASLSGEWDVVGVRGRILGITPYSHYHVVLNASETTISSSDFFQLATSRSDEGTNGADMSLLKLASDWETMSSLFGSLDFSYLHMEVWPRGLVFGDVNLDELVDGLDVDPFVDVLLNGLFQVEADMNMDGVVNGLDVDPFVAAVVGGGTHQVPEPSTLLLALIGLGVIGGWRKWKRAA